MKKIKNLPTNTQPYILNIFNKTDKVLKNIELLRAYDYLHNRPKRDYIKYAISSIEYHEFLFDLTYSKKFHVFLIMHTRMIDENNDNLKNIITITTKLVNGNQIKKPFLFKSLPYISNKLPNWMYDDEDIYEYKFDLKQFIINGLTSIIINFLPINTNFYLHLYPLKKETEIKPINDMHLQKTGFNLLSKNDKIKK